MNVNTWNRQFQNGVHKNGEWYMYLTDNKLMLQQTIQNATV